MIVDGKDHEITIEGRANSTAAPPKASCTCGWEYGPSQSLMALGTAAFDHRDKTGHGLRQHPVETVDDH